METATVKKQSNRAIQKQQATYKKKAEISEAVNLIKKYVNLSTYKFLCHFLHTNGTGVTQAKIKTICELVGISTGVYSKIVKPEIENTFSQPLIIKLKTTQKKDKLGRKNKGAEYKSLIPLSVLKHLIRAKEFEAQQEEEYFQTALEMLESDITGDITGDITSNESIPCESKGEGTFLGEQNKSFRENLLESKKDIYNTPPTQNPSGGGQQVSKIDLSIIDSKTMELLNSYKNFVDYDFWDNDLKMEMAFWIQRAINKAQADVTKLEHQHVIKEAVGTVMYQYDIDEYSKDELTKIMYHSVKNILEAILSGERETAVTSERPKKKPYQPKQSKRKVIREEMVPDWLIEQNEKDRKRAEEERKRKEQEEQEEQEKLKDPIYAEKRKKEAEKRQQEIWEQLARLKTSHISQEQSVQAL